LLNITVFVLRYLYSNLNEYVFLPDLIIAISYDYYALYMLINKEILSFDLLNAI